MLWLLIAKWRLIVETWLHSQGWNSVAAKQRTDVLSDYEPLCSRNIGFALHGRTDLRQQEAKPKLLADVDERLLASILPYLEVVKVAPFGVVVNKGDPGDSLFMVLEGELRARVMIDGKKTTLTTMGVGECFGELAIVDKGPRSADVIANQPSVLIKVSEGALRKMFAEAPALAAPFMFAQGYCPARPHANQAIRRFDSLFSNRGRSRNLGPPKQLPPS